MYFFFRMLSDNPLENIGSSAFTMPNNENIGLPVFMMRNNDLLM